LEQILIGTRIVCEGLTPTLVLRHTGIHTSGRQGGDMGKKEGEEGEKGETPLQACTTDQFVTNRKKRNDASRELSGLFVGSLPPCLSLFGAGFMIVQVACHAGKASHRSGVNIKQVHQKLFPHPSSALSPLHLSSSKRVNCHPY
jgi:hypothetical protein